VLLYVNSSNYFYNLFLKHKNPVDCLCITKVFQFLDLIMLIVLDIFDIVNKSLHINS